MVNYRTLNNKLLSRISKAKSSKAKQKVMDKIIGAYERKMVKNSKNYFSKSKFSDEESNDFNEFTLRSIRNNIAVAIENDNFDEKDLRVKLAKLVKNSREFQLGLKKETRYRTLDFKKDPPEQKYIYIITHPTKNNSVSDHDPRCYRDSQKRIFTQKEMIETSKSLPRHVNCDCRFEKYIQPKILLQQENF